MRRWIWQATVLVAAGALVARAAQGQGFVERQVGTTTVVGYKDTPLLPWTDGKYHVHDPDRPVPPYVTPGGTGDEPPVPPPSDAIVLFDGTDLSQWEPSQWPVREGYTEAAEGSLRTKQAFGDCQLHVEWMAPTTPPDRLMHRGNSGVMLMGQYEIQIFDSHPMHAIQPYPDGQAAAIYGQTPPLVNACRPPGKWQTYDIFFRAPVFKDGKVQRPALVTLVHNGVLVHLNQPIMGAVAHRHLPVYRPHPPKLPLELQGHGSPVRFRNVWIRPLNQAAARK